jgi:hypothetical protein
MKEKGLAFKPVINTNFSAYMDGFRSESGKNKPPPPRPTTSTVKTEPFGSGSETELEEQSD